MLEVKNLMVFFENALAINDLTMAVAEGEIVGVIGSNSAGKTTLMKYDLNGDPVAELFKQKRMPGSNLITWDGKNRRGKIIIPGVYFIVVKVGGKRYVKKVLVVR